MADGTLKVGTITTSSGSGTITLGQSGETIAIPSGVTLTNSGTTSGFGKVLQVVSTSLGSGDISTTSTSFVDVTGFSASITPVSTSNKILILVDIPSYITNSAANGVFTILRDSTNLGNSTWGFGWLRGGADTFLIASANYLDSPSSLSSLTYKIQYKISAGTFTMTPNGSQGTLTLMEIEG